MVPRWRLLSDSGSAARAFAACRRRRAGAKHPLEQLLTQDRQPGLYLAGDLRRRVYWVLQVIL
jgi:hypothetical protein